MLEFLPKDLKIRIFDWGAYMLFPILVLVVYRLIVSRRFFVKGVCVLLLLICLLGIWVRFVEPQLLFVRETSIHVGFTSRIAVISDLHLGPLKSEKFLRRVIQRMNTLDVDYVLVAGDWTYEPETEDLDRLFQPFAELKIPVYGVLGNHDVERPGPPLRKELVEILERNGVNMLNNEIVSLKNFALVGFGDLWSAEDDTSILNTLSANENIITLMHNPDTLDKFQSPILHGLSVAGHTHCGQVRIPFFYKKAIPTRGEYDKGYTEEPNGKLFITCGVGETALSLRFLNPPTIDILNLR